MKSSPQRIIAKQVNWLGDVVMTQPALRALRGAYPNAHLTVLIKRELTSFFDGAQWVDATIGYRVRSGVSGIGDQLNLIRQLRRGAYDLGILFPDSFQSALWFAAAGITRRVGYIRDARGPLLTDGVARTTTTTEGHQVHYRLHMLNKALGITGDPDAFTIDVAPEHRERMATWLRERRKMPDGDLIALAVGAAYGPAKEWPAPHFTELIDKLATDMGAECVLVGSPGERAKCETIAAASNAGALIAAGDTSVGELIALLSLCTAFAGNDSGSMHVAGALGLPTVGIFGSTRPGRTSPLGGRTHVVQHQIDCSPCMKRTCQFGHYRCLTEIRPEQVAAALAHP